MENMLVPFARLHPTQGALGLVQAHLKQAQTAQVPERDRPSFMQERAILVVRAPDEDFYVIDHHHWARAWRQSGMTEVPARIVLDLQQSTPSQFMDEMSARGWFHPYDEHGRETSVSALPRSIEAMPDDPYQSLAAFARMAGVFQDPEGFNAKFAWADFFRPRVQGDFATVWGFAKALADALSISRGAPDAKNLPGYIGAGR